MSLPKNRFTFITDRPYWWVYVTGLVLVLLTGWLWWQRVYMSPSNVFWGMLEQSLSTRSVVIETSQQSQESTINQHIQFELGDVNMARSITNLTQGNTKVQTEIIGTPTTDYSRYRSIKTDQKNAEGKPLDVSKVVGVWSKSDGQQQSANSAGSNQLFAQALLGIGLPVGSVPVPVGNLTPAQRDVLLGQIKSQQVYETSFKDLTKTRHKGRSVYVYDVKIQTILYVRMMKQFAKQLGLSQLEAVDANTYRSSAPLEVTLTVDARSRQLVAVDRGQGYTQSYAGYGVPLQAEVPRKAISASEMQQRLISL
jgi:hypothetical protein